MNELQRQAYLKAMEIQPFYLKRPLSGAKASPSYDFPVEPVETAHQAEGGDSGSRFATNNEAVPAGRVSRPDLGDLKAELKQLPKPRVPASNIVPKIAETGHDQPSEESDESFAFKIRYYRIDDQLSVIDEIPYAQDDTNSTARLELLKAILSALKVNWDDQDFRTENVSWPVDAAMKFEESPKVVAEQVLGGFIAQRHQIDKFKNLLVFAGQIESLLSKADADAQDFIEDPLGFHMTLTSTLSAMLSYPLLKRQVWAQLQPLGKRLSASSLVD